MTALRIGWTAARLADVCQVVSGGTPKTGVAEYWDGDVPWITPKDLARDKSQVVHGGARRLTRAGLSNSSARLFPAGSVIVSSRAPIGYVAIAGEEMCTNQGCKIAVPPAEINSRYLYWYLLNAKDDMESRASGTTFKEISGKEFGQTILRWPSLDEQLRIVDLLEDHLSRLDKAQSLLTTAKVRLAAYKASARDLAVTGGAGNVGVGADLASGWRWASVQEFADPARGSMTIGPFGSNLKVVDYRDSGVPLVFVRNVRSEEFGAVGCRYVTPEKAEELRAHRVEPGDVVITKMGDPPGEAAVYKAERAGVITADVIRIRPAPGVDPDYLALALNSSLVRQQIADITRGVAQQKVSLGRYRSEVLVPTPAFHIQGSVAAAFAEHLDAKSRIEAAIQSLQLKRSALKRSLLSAAFEGRL